MGVIDRVFTWRADDVITQITDRIRGVETSYDVDVVGRVTRVTHQHAGGTATQNMPQGDRAGSSSQAQYSQAGFGQNQPNQCGRPGGEESYSYSQAGVLTKLHPDTATRWADDVDSYGGTMPYQVGRTRFTYDKAGRVTQTVTKRLSKKPLVKHFYYDNGTQPVGYEDSDHPGVGWRYLYDGACRRVGKEQINTVAGEVISRVMFLHEGDVLFGEYHAVNTMDPHVVGSAVLWPTDPGTGEILGQITINTNTTGSVTHQDGGNGYYPGGYGGDTGGSNNADDPYNQHNNPHGGYSDGSYNHNDSTTDGAGGVLGWPQQRVDAAFYSMVCDLAGAPKELIDPTTGELVGYATYTLFGKRHWAGMVSTPLLFTGQYEDAESGWVYNRFRYYDPHAGVYNAQDPLGLLANLGTAQGYVTNPVTWVDVLGLKKCNVGSNNIDPRKLPHERYPAKLRDGTFCYGNPGSQVIGSEEVARVKQYLEDLGFEIHGEQIGITNGVQTTYADIVISRKGSNMMIPVEVKNPTGSQTSAQRTVYQSLKGGEEVWFKGTEAAKWIPKKATLSRIPIGIRVDEITKVVNNETTVEEVFKLMRLGNARVGRRIPYPILPGPYPTA